MKLALVGIGKIALDQHVPAISASPDWELAATVSRHGTVEGVPAYTRIEEMLSSHPEIEVVSLCLPPVPRFLAARAALEAGRHVMLEKPPGATLAEVYTLEAMAAARGLTLFATWHSRMAHAVAAAKSWLADRKVHSGRITWREDVRKWHPGQEWIWQPGGLGVFDPGINALSILTRILPRPVRLTTASLSIPQGRQTPIAADLEMCAGETPITAAFDWRETGDELWRITLQTDRGAATLDKGGAEFSTDGEVIARGENREYANLYARMRDLVRAGQSDLDLAPMRLVADAFINARFAITEPFDA